MFQLRQVGEIPLSAAERLPESASISHAAALTRKHSLEAVLVLDPCGTVRGLVQASLLRQLAERVPQAPLRMVPVEECIEVTPTAQLGETLQALLRHGAGGALVARVGHPPGLITRARMVGAGGTR